MSDLSTIEEYLEKTCLCHEDSDLNYALESLPPSIKQPYVKTGYDCKHGQEKQIKQALRKFKKFIETKSQFKMNERVELAETPFIDEHHSWGWIGSKHFLVEGAKATVEEVSYYNGHFGYDIVVDTESWKDSKDVLHPRSDKKCQIPGCDFTHNIHTYYFRENQLRPIVKERCSFLSKLWSEFHKIGD